LKYIRVMKVVGGETLCWIKQDLNVYGNIIILIL